MFPEQKSNETAMTQLGRDGPNWALGGILAAAFLLRVMHLGLIRGSDLMQLPVIDSAFYHNWAKAIAGGDLLGRGIFFMSPLYPYLMGVVYAIAGAYPWAVMFLQAYISLETIRFLHRLAVKAVGPQAGLVTAGLAAVYAPFMFYDGALLTASLILFLSVLILNFAWDALHREKRGDLVKLGLAIGFSALARPLVLVFFPFLFLAFYYQQRATALKKIGWTALLTAVVLLPVGLRNLIVGGEFTLTTSSAGMNFYVGNNKDATGLYWEAPFLTSVEPGNEDEEYRRTASRALGRELTTREAGGYWFRQALDWMLNNPGSCLKLLAQKAFYFFSRAEFANNVSFYLGQVESSLLRFNPFGFWLMAPLGLAGLILLGRRRGWRSNQILIWWVAAYFTGTLLFFASSEYRLPVVLVLLIGAGFLIVEFSQEIRARRAESALKIMVMVLIFMPLVNFRTSFIRRGENARMDYFNFGNTLLAKGDYPGAIKRFEKALAIDPWFEEGLHRLAEAYYRSGNLEKTREIGRKVGLAKPDDMIKLVQGGALREAYALLDEGRYQEAMREFSTAGMDSSEASAETTRVSLLEQAREAYRGGRREEAVKIFQQIRSRDRIVDPSVCYNIAFLLWQQGKLDSAEVYLTEALRVDSLNAPSGFLLARIYNATNRREQAERLMQRINPDQDTHQAILQQAREEMDSLARRGEWEKALQAYSIYGRLGYETAPEDKVRLGRLQLEVGNLDLALRLFSEAESAGGASAELFLHNGRALQASGRAEEAMASFQKSAAADPNLIETRIALARMYLARSEYQKAWRELDAVGHLEIIDETVKKEYSDLMQEVKAKM